MIPEAKPAKPAAKPVKPVEVKVAEPAPQDTAVEAAPAKVTEKPAPAPASKPAAKAKPKSIEPLDSEEEDNDQLSPELLTPPDAIAGGVVAVDGAIDEAIDGGAPPGATFTTATAGIDPT